MILDEILAVKQRDHSRRMPAALDTMWAKVQALPPARPFAEALKKPHAASPDGLAVIAEFKRKSPSGGAIRPNADPADIARRYQLAGAAAISVLTDQLFFGGSLDDLTRVHGAVSVPLLRKDFLLDERDILEARLAGADAILLIVRILDRQTLPQLIKIANSAGMTALVEAHSDGEIGAALAAGADVIGVNHRDLDTLTIDLGLSARARELAPDAILVGESGIATPADVALMRAHKVDAILVGESLLRAKDPGEALAELMA